MLKLEYKDYTLDFKFEAGTSRGVLRKHPIALLKLSLDGIGPYGYGEAAPLERLSVDDFEGVKGELERLRLEIAKCRLPGSEEEVFEMVAELVKVGYPSVRLALETALLDLLNGGRRMVFRNGFYSGDQSIPINGLIWMGDFEEMKSRAEGKLNEGFKCIKIKIGAIDWERELALIEFVRSKSAHVTIRLDANGGLPLNRALSMLTELEKFDIHSIEQPIMPRQPEAMHLICEKSKIPIALDEELIGINDDEARKELLEYIRPSYVILKPTLLGGFAATKKWIGIAEGLGIDWWMTSALESNVGLNAISQFTAGYDRLLYQGLGTGQLYANNIKSPLHIKSDRLVYKQDLSWDLPF